MTADIDGRATVRAAAEQDPRWQAARHDLIREDYPSPEDGLVARFLAIHEMFVIERTIEVARQ